MPVKHFPALRIAAVLGLGLGSAACGPIAFNDSINFKLAAPEPEPEPVAAASHASLDGDHIIIDTKIQFEYNSSDIKPESFEILDDVVKLMSEHAEIAQIDIVGHTSSEGKSNYNQRLSAARAAAVVSYMTDKGVGAERLGSTGKGEDQPIADNDTETGKQANRRVEFVVTEREGAEAHEGEAGTGEAASDGARGVPGKTKASEG